MDKKVIFEPPERVELDGKVYHRPTVFTMSKQTPRDLALAVAIVAEAKSRRDAAQTKVDSTDKALCLSLKRANINHTGITSAFEQLENEERRIKAEDAARFKAIQRRDELAAKHKAWSEEKQTYGKSIILINPEPVRPDTVIVPEISPVSADVADACAPYLDERYLSQALAFAPICTDAARAQEELAAAKAALSTAIEKLQTCASRYEDERQREANSKASYAEFVEIAKTATRREAEERKREAESELAALN